MRLLIYFVAVLISVEAAIAQSPPPQPSQPANPFDLSAVKELIGTAGLPTVDAVEALEQQAQALLGAGDCTGAVDVLDRYARQANTLANLIASGLDPFYDASYDDRKTFPPARLRMLIPLEKLANDYKAERNHAMIMQAECLAKLGDKERAAQLFFQALNLTSLGDAEWWDRERTGLYNLLGVK